MIQTSPQHGRAYAFSCTGGHSFHIGTDLLISLLPPCYQNSPSNGDPRRSCFFRILGFSLCWVFLGRLSIGWIRFVNRRSSLVQSGDSIVLILCSTPPHSILFQPTPAKVRISRKPWLEWA